MKKLAIAFDWIGFIIQYIVPIFLFSDVVPFVVRNPDKTLTTVGAIAFILAGLFLWKKFKKKILELPKAWWRALILSAPSIVTWLIVWKLLGTVTSFIVSLGNYWTGILVYIIIGRVFAILSETFYNIEPRETKNKGENAGEING
jgi:uncharacterized membrane protein YeaQ/YmgE (transglycosylase-associated protein family)